MDATQPTSKKCRKCGEDKPLSEFYKGRGKLGVYARCKACIVVRVTTYLRANVEKYREYEKKRYNDPSRTAKRRLYNERMRERHPEKFRAYSHVTIAKKRGLWNPGPCEVCGTTENIEGHHDDYSKPLEVRWLCKQHHQEHHRNVRKSKYHHLIERTP